MPKQRKTRDKRQLKWTKIKWNVATRGGERGRRLMTAPVRGWARRGAEVKERKRTANRKRKWKQRCRRTTLKMQCNAMRCDAMQCDCCIGNATNQKWNSRRRSSSRIAANVAWQMRLSSNDLIREAWPTEAGSRCSSWLPAVPRSRPFPH